MGSLDYANVASRIQLGRVPAFTGALARRRKRASRLKQARRRRMARGVHYVWA